MEAEGTDGRKLQLRGGGVIRVRPDGTGLELFSYGTRNILQVALSPLLDGFARDNTNDGDGWDTRFHHFTGMENHGYPRFYQHFADEEITPLADYGGGAGCGACWIEDPNWPAAWNNKPFTCDWGRGEIYSHPVVPKGRHVHRGRQAGRVREDAAGPQTWTSTAPAESTSTVGAAGSSPTPGRTSATSPKSCRRISSRRRCPTSTN